MGLVRDENALRRKRARRETTTAVIAAMENLTVGVRKTLTLSVDSSGNAVVVVHDLDAEALLDLIDAQTVDDPVAHTITRLATGALTLA